MIEVDNLQLAVKDVFDHGLIVAASPLHLDHLIPRCRRNLLVTGGGAPSISRFGERAPVEGLFGGAVGWGGFRLRQVGEVQEEVAGVKVAVHDPQRVHLLQGAEQLPD